MVIGARTIPVTVPTRDPPELARRPMRVVTGFAEIAVRPRMAERNAVLDGARRHQGRQGRSGFVIWEPWRFFREAHHFDLHNRLVVMSYQGRPDRPNLHKLGDSNSLRIRVEAEHEMRGIVSLEYCKTTGPPALGCVKNSRSRRVEAHPLIEMRYSAYVSYWKLTSLI